MDDKFETTTYFPDGSIETSTDCKGDTYTYTYYNKNLLRKIKKGEDTLITYTYLDNFLTDTAENENGIIDFDYDIYNRSTSIDGPLPGNVDKIEYQYYENGQPSQLKYYVDGNPKTVDYYYNALDQITEVDYNGEKSTSYSYDTTIGQLITKLMPNGTVTSYTCDDIGRIISINNTSASGETIDSFLYRYNDAGLIDKITYADGRYTEFGYDNLYRLGSEIQRTAADSTLYDLRHTIDYSGNRTGLKYDNDPGKVLTFTSNPLSQVTAYSGTIGNKVNVTGKLPSPWSIENITVTPNSQPSKAITAQIIGDLFIARNVELNDSTNNSITASSDDTTKAGNNVTSATVTGVQFDQTPNITYDYDDNGNRISKVDGTDTTTYIYDFLDRLIEIEYPAGASTKFFYDPAGRKFKEQELDDLDQVVSERRYVYEGFKVLLELDENNQTVREYIHGPSMGGGVGGILFQQDDDSHCYYYNYNARGDVTSITDEAGNIIALYEYSAYGKLLTRAGSFPNEFLYSTKQLHDKSGLYNFGFRWYDPTTTQWLTRDPLGVAGGLNLYQNVSNDPINLFDPFGLCPGPHSPWKSLKNDLISLGKSMARPDKAIADLIAASIQVAEDFGDPMAGVIYGLGKLTGMATLAEGIVGYDILTGQKLDGINRTARVLGGTGQGMLTGVGLYKAIGPTRSQYGKIPESSQGKSWTTQRKSYWKNELDKGRRFDSLSKDLIKNGRSPMGKDGFPIELHHPDKIGNPYLVKEMTRTQHRLNGNYLKNHPR